LRLVASCGVDAMTGEQSEQFALHRQPSRAQPLDSQRKAAVGPARA
jgi:hypothetical protein